MASTVARWHSLVSKNARLVKAAWRHTQRLLEEKLPQSIRTSQAEAQPIYLRNAPKQPIHPVAYIRQSKGRWYTTHSTLNAAVRKFTTSARASGSKFDRASLPKSKIGSAVYASTGRAPFASTLRPNLTGGAFARTAGGYGLGSGGAGSARYFSHSPASPAQVIHNVSQGMRAFFISGQRIQFDGANPRTGEKRYRAVSALQDTVGRQVSSVPRATPGSYVDFNINPTITAITPLAAVAGFAPATQKQSLSTEDLLDVLSVDFSRALKDLSGVLNDLKRLSSLGDLPITYHTTSLRIHFPGCDADTVERLCVELGVVRGVVYEDEDFDVFAGTEIALLFPFAPSKTASEMSFYERPVAERTARQDAIDWRHMLSPRKSEVAVDKCSTRSELELDFEEIGAGNPWLSESSPSGYESVGTVDLEERAGGDWHSPLEYQGIEGIYRFMEQCEGSTVRC